MNRPANPKIRTHTDVERTLRPAGDLYKLESVAYQTNLSIPQVGSSNPNYLEKATELTSSSIVLVPTDYNASKNIRLVSGFHANSSNYFHGKILNATVWSNYSIKNDCVPISRIAVNGELQSKILEDPDLMRNKFPPNFRVFPNPASSSFSVDSKVTGKMKLISSFGIIAKEYLIEVGVNNFDLPNFISSGMYKMLFDDASSLSISIIR